MGPWDTSLVFMERFGWIGSGWTGAFCDDLAGLGTGACFDWFHFTMTELILFLLAFSTATVFAVVGVAAGVVPQFILKSKSQDLESGRLCSVE